MMMKAILAILCVLLAGLSGFHLIGNFSGGSHALQAKKVYSYATAQQQKNGAAFGIFHNNSNSDMRIIGARSDVAERIELHTHMMDGGIMMMREVEGYDVPAGGNVTLEPMGHHIMLMGLKNPLRAGESFALTLETQAGETFETQVAILPPGSKP